MTPIEELFVTADELSNQASSSEKKKIDEELKLLEDAVDQVGRAFSGSWLGYHARVYYADFVAPPRGEHFSQENGLTESDIFGHTSASRGWREYDPQEVRAHIFDAAGIPSLESMNEIAAKASGAFDEAKALARSVLLDFGGPEGDQFIAEILQQIDSTKTLSTQECIRAWSPSGQFISSDMVAIGQGVQAPPHFMVLAEARALKSAFLACNALEKLCRRAASHLERKAAKAAVSARVGTNVFVGHGRASAWLELKEFIKDRLNLPYDEFNRVPVAGISNQVRLAEMLEAAAVAFVIMTAEDEQIDGASHARMNVIHEVGLFQGRLGFTKAIILLEEGCEEFSNIQGLGQIRFPAGKISACFEDVRLVLEREGLIGE